MPDNVTYTNTAGMRSADMRDLEHYFQISSTTVAPIIENSGIYSISISSTKRFLWTQIWNFVGYDESVFTNEANHYFLKAPLMTVARVSGVLGDSEATLKRYAALGKLPAIKIGKLWRFRTFEICHLAYLPTEAAHTLYRP